MATTMLRELSIRNLAVVEEAVVPFAPGLNVLTGETGAGKSIVVDALLLITGARAQLDWIRTGADTALVEAVFEIDPAGPVAALLDEAGHHPGDGQLVIKRELARSGRHRAFVNDGAATVGLLERLGELLVELHGQHEHQRLMEPARQLLLLDRFAEAFDRRERVGALVRRWEEARAALDRLRSEMREGARQEDLYRFQLAEIDDVRLKGGEEEELRAERSRLQHAERIVAGLQETVGLLYEEPQSATTRLSRAATLLRDLSRYEPEAAALSQARTRGAERLERLIQKEIRGLGMEHGRFRVALRREPAAVGELAAGLDGWRVGARGAESAELLLSANPGEDLRPLTKVVSGGELSRVMLAAKTVLAAADDVPVLVFDEVDAGIGGRVADVVGQKLRASAVGRQVLCVTHLAPIAAYAGHHLLVEKRVTRGATRTSVTPLREAARVDEVARMLGGERVTETSRRHARELLRGSAGGVR